MSTQIAIKQSQLQNNVPLSDRRSGNISICILKNVYAGHLIHTARSNCTSISVVLYHPNG